MQTINPEISKAKFNEELQLFLSCEEVHRKRGILLLKSEFPDIILSFSATQINPAVHVFAVRINYDNYDLQPLSVRFINPFTWENLHSMPTPLMPRKIVNEEGIVTEYMDLVQKDLVGLPFICLPGIREYHEHPAHTGNSWLLHRKCAGEGTLGFLIEKFYEFGIATINSFSTLINFQVQIPNIQLGYDKNAIPT